MALGLLLDDSPTSLRSILIGYEQVACYLAFVVALLFLRKGLRRARLEPRLGGRALLDIPTGRVLRRNEVRPFVLTLNDESHPLRGTTASTAFSNGLVIFENGGSMQEVLSSVRQDFEALGAYLDSSLGLVRYLIWAIPALGFVGTVRGMGDALGAANLYQVKVPAAGAQSGVPEAATAVSDMLNAVTKHLGVAFNTTLVALLLSLVLMWIFHHVQEDQEKTVLAVEESCRKELIRSLQAS